MKKNKDGKNVLTACEIQAHRLNQVEYRRLQHNVDIMNDDLKTNLARLQRQAHSIRFHYINVVKVVQTNLSAQLWKQEHGYQIRDDKTKNWLELTKLEEKFESKIHQQIPSSNELPSESVRPLLLLLDNDVQKPVEPIIDFSENFLRPKTSPFPKHSPNRQRKNRLLTMLSEHPINSNNRIRSQRSSYSASSSLSPSIPSGSRKFEQSKLRPTTQEASTLDALYRIALQNQTAYNSVEQTHIEKRKLLDKEFATQHRALKGSIRSTGLIK